MQRPILAIGILMSIALMLELSNRGIRLGDPDRYNTYSCQGALSGLKHYYPGNWRGHCKKNNLHIEIDYSTLPILKQGKDEDFIRQYVYRELANQMAFLADNAPEENLRKTDIISLRVYYPPLTLNAVTEGQYSLQIKTLKDPKLIADHLKATVQVQEVWKQ